jgi:hypothetical protein
MSSVAKSADALLETGRVALPDVNRRSGRRQRQDHKGPVHRLVPGPFLAAFVLLLASSGAGAACVEPSTLVRSTVGIARYFDEQERAEKSGLFGIRGTGWFVSQGSLLTAAHVAEAMHLTKEDWKQVEIRQEGNTQAVLARVVTITGPHTEKIALLELKAPVPDAQVLQLRTEPLAPDERVTSIAYPSDRLRFAGGRFVQYGTDGEFAGTALFELYDGDDRLVLDHGASGAPVLDCQGRAVAVVSNLLTKTIQFLSNTIRVPTAWQSPNVVSVPIQVINDFARTE